MMKIGVLLTCTCIGAIIGIPLILIGLSKMDEPVEQENLDTNSNASHTSSITTVKSNNKQENTREETDAWEGWFDQENESKNLTLDLSINYIDGEGQKTQRKITTKRFNKQMILAHCHLRNANRTFHFARIKNATDVETGEIYPDLYQTMTTLYEQSLEYAYNQFAEKYSTHLKILFFLGKADGALRAKERAFIFDFCAHVLNDERFTIEYSTEMLKNIEHVTLYRFKTLSNALDRTDEHTPFFLEIAQKLVESDKKVSDSEKEALDYLFNPKKSNKATKGEIEQTDRMQGHNA